MSDWRDDGKCRDRNPDDWYSTDLAVRESAILICAGCPVQALCLSQALENRERYGVWGGVDFEEPRRAARAQYVRLGRPPKRKTLEPVT